MIELSPADVIRLRALGICSDAEIANPRSREEELARRAVARLGVDGARLRCGEYRGVCAGCDWPERRMVMVDTAVILKAFMLGAPLEALSLLLGIDAEDVVRREMRLMVTAAQGAQADAPDEHAGQRRDANRNGEEEPGERTAPHGPAIILPAERKQ